MHYSQHALTCMLVREAKGQTRERPNCGLRFSKVRVVIAADSRGSTEKTVIQGVSSPKGRAGLEGAVCMDWRP